MVRYQKRIMQGRLPIPKSMRKTGFENQIEIAPNLVAAAIYPQNTNKTTEYT